MFARALRSSQLLSMPARQAQQLRRLNLHEFQSIEIMKSFGVASPKGVAASTPEEAEAAFNKIRGGQRTFVAVMNATVVSWEVRHVNRS